MESNSSVATVVHFRHKRGDTFIRTIQFFTDKTESTPVDISNNIYKMDLVNCNGDVALSFVMANGFVINHPNSLEISKSSGEMNLCPGDYDYDLQQTTDTGEVTTVMAGKFIIDPDVTE